jgi:iron complex outermembrane receptor protein
LYGQFDFVRGDNLSGNDSLPRITPMRGKTGLRYRTGQVSGYVEGVFVGSQDHTADFEFPTDSYALLNTGAAYRLPLGDQAQTYELYMRATNLTDEEARVHSSFLKHVAPLRGRALFVGLRVAF